MRKWFMFIGITALLLTPWPVAYAHENVAAAQGNLSVAAAEESAAPSWTAYGRAIGGVDAGDLFYISTENISGDLSASLLLVNIDELVRDYRYINLNVGVYVENESGQWEKFQQADSEGDSYLTMGNGGVDLVLPSYARCKITIDRGCFYYYGNGGGKSTPDFYLSLG